MKRIFVFGAILAFGPVHALARPVSNGKGLQVIDRSSGTRSQPDTEQQMGCPVSEGDGCSPNLKVAGSQSIRNSPTGNPINTYSSFVISTNAKQASQREFASVIGLTSLLGAQFTGKESGNKVALYTAADCKAGSGDCWSINPLLSIDSGNSSAGQGIEVDVNNNSSDRIPFKEKINQISGVTVTGSGHFESSYAYGISGPNKAIWHDGYTVFNNAVSDNSFHDIGIAKTSINISGVHSYDIDTSAASAGEALRFNTDQIIAMVVPGTQSESEILAGDRNRNLYIGGSAASVNIGSPKDNDNYFNFAPGGRSISSPTFKVSGKNADIDLSVLTKGPKGCFTLNADETATHEGVETYMRACPASGIVVAKLTVSQNSIPSLNAPCTTGSIQPASDGYLYICDPQTVTWGRLKIDHR